MKTPLFFFLLICGMTVYGQSAKKLNQKLRAELLVEQQRQDSLFEIFNDQHAQLELMREKIQQEIDLLNGEEGAAREMLLTVGKRINDLKKLGVGPEFLNDLAGNDFSGHQEMVNSIYEIFAVDFEFSQVSGSLYLEGLKRKEQNELLTQKIDEYKRSLKGNAINLLQLESQQKQLEPIQVKLKSVHRIYQAARNDLSVKNAKLEEKLAELRENYRLKGPKGFSDAYHQIFPDIHPISGKSGINDGGTDKTGIEGPESSLFIDEPAQFPGGTEAMNRYLSTNLSYPQMAEEMGIQGKVLLRFSVSALGEITDVKVLKGVPGCSECDKEAMRVVKGMPKWTPAKMNGKVVVSFFNLPIEFYLN